MRTSQVLPVFAFAGLLTIAVSKPLSSPTIVARELSTPDLSGCIGGDITQRVELHSGDDLYEMFVPFGDQTYNIGEPSPVLSCVSGAKGGQCVHCHSMMDHVQLLRPGKCSLMLTDENGGLHNYHISDADGLTFFGIAGYPSLVTCRETAGDTSSAEASVVKQQLSRPGRALIRDTMDPAPHICPQTHGSNITLWKGSNKYILSVPANQTHLPLYGDETTLGCIGPVGDLHALCLGCDFKADSLQVSLDAKFCAIELEGHEAPLYLNNAAGQLTLPTPAMITAVTCGLCTVPPPNTNAGLAKRQAPESACITFPDSAVLSLKDTNWLNWKLVVSTDGTTLQLDQPGSAAGCVREKDDQCAYCDFDVQEVVIPADVGCAIEFSADSSLPTTVNFGPGVSSFTSPIQLHSIACRHIDTTTPLPAAARSVETAVTALQTAEIQCPPFANSATVRLLDYSFTSYDLEVRLDGSTFDFESQSIGQHAGCRRESDSRCFGCDSLPIILIRIPKNVNCQYWFSLNDSSSVDTHNSGPGATSNGPPIVLHNITCQHATTTNMTSAGIGRTASWNTEREVRRRQSDLRTPLPSTQCGSFQLSTKISLVDPSWSPYKLTVSTDGRVFDLNDPASSVGCAKQGTNHTDQCFLCNFDVARAAVIEGGFCVFDAVQNDGTLFSFNLTAHSAFMVEEITWDPPIHVYSVTCLDSSALILEPPGKQTTMLKARSDNCPLAEGKISLQSASEVTTLHVPADGEAYWLQDWIASQPHLGCLNTYDKQDCSSCDGEYTIVGCDVGLGLCRLDATDSRTYYFGSGTLPSSDEPPFTPSRVICGIQSDRLKARTVEPAGHCNMSNAPITLTTDGGQFAVFPPADQKPYPVDSEVANAMFPVWRNRSLVGCHALHETDHSCGTCDSALKSARINPKLGMCQFTLINKSNASDVTAEWVNATSKSGDFAFGPQRYLIGIHCGLTKNYNSTSPTISTHPADSLKTFALDVTPNLPALTARDVETELFCDRDKPAISIRSYDGNSQSKVFPPAGGQMHHAGLELGCHPCAESGSTCGQCPTQIYEVTVDPNLKFCLIIGLQSDDGSRTIYEASHEAPQNFSPSIRILEIICGLSQADATIRMQAYEETKSISATAPTEALATRTNFITLIPADFIYTTDCPASATWRTTIIGSDGNMYFTPVPLDAKFHPLSDMSCIRLVDAACIPCAQIPSATGLSIHTEWGPCIFFTQNHRQFAIQWTSASGPDATATQIMWIQPAAVVSGVECGTDA